MQTDKVGRLVVRYEMRSSTQEREEEEEEVLIFPSLFHRAGVNQSLSTRQVRYIEYMYLTSAHRPTAGGPTPLIPRRGNNNNDNDDM